MVIAQTLKEIPDSDLVRDTRNREASVDDHVTKWFETYGNEVTERNPQGKYDLFSVIIRLASKRLIAEFPKYKTSGAITEADGEYRHGGPAHGEVISVVSNAKTHAFSLRIKDHNVTQRTLRSRTMPWAPRHYRVTDDEGNFHPGIVNIVESQDEFLEDLVEHQGENGIVVFDDFTTYQLRHAFWGQGYWLGKILHRRLKDQQNTLYARAEELEAIVWEKWGKLPCDVVGTIPRNVREVSSTKRIIVRTFISHLQAPKLVGDYDWWGRHPDPENGSFDRGHAYENFGQIRSEHLSSLGRGQLESMLRYADSAKRVVRRKRELIQAHLRAIDNSVRDGFKEDGVPKNPGWGLPPRYTKSRIVSRGRYHWDKLMIAGGFSLYYRFMDRKVRVSSDYMGGTSTKPLNINPR